MKTGSLRLKALALTLLLLGGSVGLPALDLIVWHLDGSTPVAVSHSNGQGTGTDHERQCLFTHQMPSSQPATPASDGLVLSSLGTTAPTEQPTPRLISAEVQRAHPPRAPPVPIV